MFKYVYITLYYWQFDARQTPYITCFPNSEFWKLKSKWYTVSVVRQTVNNTALYIRTYTLACVYSAVFVCELPGRRFQFLKPSPLTSRLDVDRVWNVMAHAQKPDFVSRRNGRVHLNRQGRQFSRLLAAEVCASAVVMLDTPNSEVVWRGLATYSIRQFPLHFPPVRHRVPSRFKRSLPMHRQK